MDILLFSLGATMPAVASMALGLLLRLRGAVDEAFVNKLSDIVFLIFLQCHLFSNVYSIDFQTEFSLDFVLFALCGIAALIAAFIGLYHFLIKGDRRKRAACAQVSFRSNYLMFGVAIVQNMYGEAGVRVAAMLVPIAVPFFNVAAVILLTCAAADTALPLPILLKNIVSGVLKSPLVITCALGLAAGMSGLVIPGWIDSTIKSLGGAATPLCLILLGAQIDWKSLKSSIGDVVAMSCVRLIAVPLIMIPIAVRMGFRGPYLASLFVLFASPCAHTALIMAHKYDVYPKFTAQVVALTTIASGLTSFVGISLLRYLRLF